MSENSMYEVVVKYHDPFNIWETLRQSMESILPLPVNVKKIKASHWKKHISFPSGFKTEFPEGGGFRCKYVKADNQDEETDAQRVQLAKNEPTLELYVLPPMEHPFFKQNVKSKLKSFLVERKSKHVIVIYGICNKENKTNQKTNRKTIELIRRVFCSIFLSQNRLCLVPMLGIPLLRIDGTSKVEDGVDIDTLGFKNWENVQLAMGECISDIMIRRLIEIGETVRRTNDPPSSRLTMLYEEILRILVSCGLLSDALEGYVFLIDYIEPDVKKNSKPMDLEIVPFIFYINNIYPMQNETSYFDIYQHLCCVALKILGFMKSKSNLVRICRLILRFCTTAVTTASRLLQDGHQAWSLVLLHASIKYINELENEAMKDLRLVASANKDIVDAKGDTEDNSHEDNNTVDTKKVELNVSNIGENDYQSLEQPTFDNVGSQVSPEATKDADDYTPGCDIEAVYNSDEKTCIRRCIALLYTMLYKVMLRTDSVLEEFLEIRIPATTEDICSARYRDSELEMLEQLNSPEKRTSVLLDIFNKCSLSSSEGLLDRHAAIMQYLHKNSAGDLSSISESVSRIRWDIRRCSDPVNKQVFTWFDATEPNISMENPLDCIKQILCASKDTILPVQDMCLSPCHMEDENVNAYIDILRGAKPIQADVEKRFEGSGQLLLYKTMTWRFTLSLYSSEEFSNAKISVLLREESCSTPQDRHVELRHYEEMELLRKDIRKGHNLYEIEHTFKKLCNYIQESVTIKTQQIHLVQRARSPIPLELLSDVVGIMKSRKLPSKYVLSTLMLPARIIYEPEDKSPSITLGLCGDPTSFSVPVIAPGSRNFIAFHIRCFTGGKICLMNSSLRYDLDEAYLLSDGTKSGFSAKAVTPNGMELTLANDGTSNHLICIPAELTEGTQPDILYQVVRLLSDTSMEFRLQYLVVPPFSREVLSNQDATIQAIIEPNPNMYTKIDQVIVNGCVSVNEPTLLEQGYRYHISIDEPSEEDLGITDNHILKQTDKEITKDAVIDEFTRSDHDDSKTEPELDGEPTSSNIATDDTASKTQNVEPCARCAADISSPDNDVIVRYRLLRQPCIHQRSARGTELQTPSRQLEYRFRVPCAQESDVFVEYKAPPFCMLNTVFNATIVVRGTREVCFDYELETNEHWFVEGPVRGRSQLLAPREELQLKFKMMALDSAEEGLVKLPSISFWRLRAPVVYKEIFIIKYFK